MSYLGFYHTPDERLWAAMAHASIALGILLGLLFGGGITFLTWIGPIAALIIFIIKKDQSRWVARQAMQAILYQFVWAIIGLAISWVVLPMLGILRGLGLPLIGPVLWAFYLLSLLFLLYGLYAAYQCYRGRNFKYWLIGDWMRGMG